MEGPGKLRWAAEIIIPFIVMYFALAYETRMPYHIRGFFCDDQKLNLPFVESSVSNALVYGSGGLPCLVILLTTFHILPARKIHRLWTSYAMGITCLYLMMNLIKLFYGELRPHFFEACKPVWPGMNCSKYVAEFNCTGANRRQVIESLRSFPSSHAGITSFSMLYLIIYTQELYMNRKSQYHFIWAMLQFSALLWSLYVGFSRITDNKHHASDVVAGYILGCSTCFWVAYQWSDLHNIFKPETSSEQKVLTEKQRIIAHCTSQNGISVGGVKKDN